MIVAFSERAFSIHLQEAFYRMCLLSRRSGAHIVSS